MLPFVSVGWGKAPSWGGGGGGDVPRLQHPPALLFHFSVNFRPWGFCKELPGEATQGTSEAGRAEHNWKGAGIIFFLF